MCSLSLGPIDWALNNSLIRDVLDLIAMWICELEGIHGGIPSVCKGAIDIMAVNVLPAIALGELSPQRICDEYFHVCNDPVIRELSADDFVKKRLDAKPKMIDSNDFIDQIYAKIKADPNRANRTIIRSI